MDQAFSVFLLADTVVDHAANYLAKTQPLRMTVDVAPYNQVTQYLLDVPKARFLLLWTSPDIQVPAYKRLLDFEMFAMAEATEQVDVYADQVRRAAQGYEAVFLLSWSVPNDRRWPYGLGSRVGQGPSDVLRRMNVRMADALAEVPNLHIIDQDLLLSRFNGATFDPRLNSMARMRYSIPFLKYAAERIAPVIGASIVASRKLIICDLDNTLWGGVVGDDGVDRLKLGANDPVGEAHLLLQRELKALVNRGVLLAISSKNDESTALQALDSHPNMLLRSADFVARRINWGDKAENIASMLSELNLLASSAVFIDDNPSERQRVRDAMPDLLVPDLPKDVSHWPRLLSSLGCLETLALSTEDKARTALYARDALRQKDRALHTSLDDWLHSLGLVVTVAPLDHSTAPRAVQLVNKTNQFNLHTRRFTEASFLEWCASPNRRCSVFSVADRYGDSGLTAVVSAESIDSTWTITDFVMSCRVMGKGVEDAILAAMIRLLGTEKPVFISATPTPKNGPGQEFVTRIAHADGTVPFDMEPPSHITLRGA